MGPKDGGPLAKSASICIRYFLILFCIFLLFAFEVQPSFSANVCPAQIIFQGPQDAPGRLGDLMPTGCPGLINFWWNGLPLDMDDMGNAVVMIFLIGACYILLLP